VITVSNSSPIINLAAVGKLKLLRQLYGKVAIPQAVRHEIVTVGAGQPGAAEVETLDWIETHQVTDRTIVASRLGLKFIGILGVLIDAKNRGLVQAVKPILNDLTGKAGFWITPELYDLVLQATGE
jgi:predicted nucleic acid-binding protein